MPARSASTSARDGGGAGPLLHHGAMGWDGMGSSDPQKQSQQPAQEANGSLRLRKPQGCVLLQDGVRTRSHPEHPRWLLSSHLAAQSTEASDGKSLSHIRGFHIAAGSKVFVPTNISVVAAHPCEMAFPQPSAGITPSMSIPAPLL